MKLNKREMDKDGNINKIPFYEYFFSITDADERCVLRKRLAQKIMKSEPTISRYLHGIVRPGLLERRIIANVIRNHSGDKSWTGDKLFPASFYNNRRG